MYIVFSFWYIVLAVLLIGAIVLTCVYVKMNKKDNELIKEFIASNSNEENGGDNTTSSEESVEAKDDLKKESK